MYIVYLHKCKAIYMDTNLMYKMYQEGMSLEKVGRNFGITRQSVYLRFKNKNLELRPKKYKPFIIYEGYKFTINKCGYYESTLIDRLMLHNYVWELNNGKIPKGYEIHHIDLNKTNNDISNLMLLTPSEHSKLHRKIMNGSGMNRKVRCIENGNTYDSISHLAREVGQHASNVSRYYIDAKRKLNGLTYEKY